MFNFCHSSYINNSGFKVVPYKLSLSDIKPDLKENSILKTVVMLFFFPVKVINLHLVHLFILFSKRYRWTFLILYVRERYSLWKLCTKIIIISSSLVHIFDEASFFFLILFAQSISRIQILDEADCLSTITQGNFPPLRWGSVKLGEKMIRGHFHPRLLREGYWNIVFFSEWFKLGAMMTYEWSSDENTHQNTSV